MSKPEKDEIATLEAKVKALRAELAGYETLLRRDRVAASGVSIGDVVTSNGKRYRVTGIDPYFHPAMLTGNPERKDGSFGRSKRRLFDYWERIAS